MKTLFTSIAVLIFTAAHLPVNASALNTVKTTVYRGNVILLFELPEVEIKAERLIKRFPLKPVSIRSDNYSDTLNKVYSAAADETVEAVDFNNSIYSNLNTMQKDGTENCPVQNMKYLIIGTYNNEKNVVYTKRPFFHFITNKACHLGFRFFEMVNDGLFFRS
jgi:hypothetical protein